MAERRDAKAVVSGDGRFELAVYLIGGETEGVEFNGVHYGHHPDLLLIGDITAIRPEP
ncbi:MAG: hypothetical protein M3463_02150 [Verrucomicrobiota bacterium]|nr:hypothetical protein [Verrucomicrobiota bacterium]